MTENTHDTSPVRYPITLPTRPAGRVAQPQSAPHAPAAAPSDQPRRRRPRVTDISEQDREWLRWLARYGYATTTHLCRRFNVVDRVARRRCYRLRDLRLVYAHPVVHAGRQVWLPTSTALRLVRYDGLPTPTFGLSTFLHNCAVLDIATKLELQGHRVVSERELWASSSGATPTNEVFHARIAMRKPQGSLINIRPRPEDLLRKSQPHIPDLIVVGGYHHIDGMKAYQKNLAIEVELNVKTRRIMREILRGYDQAHDDGWFDKTLYLVGSDRIGRAVQATAKKDPRLVPTWLKIELLHLDELTVRLPEIAKPGPAETFEVPWDWADHYPFAPRAD